MDRCPFLCAQVSARLSHDEELFLPSSMTRTVEVVGKVGAADWTLNLADLVAVCLGT